MIKIYDLATKYPDVRFSPFVWRIKYALAHKGLEWEEAPLHFTEMSRLPDPNVGLVPVLVDGSTVVHDSWSIAEYLDEAYPERPLFKSAEAKAQCLLFKHWSERVWHPLVSKIGIMDFYDAQRDAEKTYFRESREKRFQMTLEEWGGNSSEAREQLLKILEPVRQVIASFDFLGGDTPSFSDYIALGVMQWIRCGSRVEMFDKEDPINDYQNRLLDLYDGLGRRGGRIGDH
ncbi:MAG: glutathione S-transferase N-terminal domain-containing protein [Betaproteobacteria bacterium]